MSRAFAVLMVLVVVALSDQIVERTAASEEASRSGVAQDLGTFGGTSWASAVNDADTIVGTSSTPSGLPHPFVWRDGIMTELIVPGGEWGNATDINNAGQIVGFVYRSDLAHAIVWENDVAHELPPLAGRTEAVAEAISETGMVVGSSAGSAVLWQNGSAVDLGVPFAGAAQMFALGVNNVGEIVGVGGNAVGTFAWYWSAGVFTELPVPSGTTLATAYGINDAGLIVGSYYDPATSEPRATTWQHGVRSDLPMLPGGAWSEARAVNNKGRIVGTTFRGSHNLGTVWEDGKAYGLGPLPGDQQNGEALGVSEKGIAVGSSYQDHRNPQFRAVAWWRVCIPTIGC